MSTNSYIGIKHADDTITAIYCHWDGGLWESGVGEVLYLNYGEHEARKLMAIGGISALYPSMEETKSQAYNEDPNMEFTINEWANIFTARDQGDTYGYPEFLYLWDTERREWMVLEESDTEARSLGAALESEKTRFALAASLSFPVPVLSWLQRT